MTQSNSPRSLPCPTCNVAIDLSTIQWCRCVSKELSVVCPSCDNCFCGKRNFPMVREWTLILCELRQQQTEEKFRRALDLLAVPSPDQRTVLIVDDDEEIRLIAEYTVQKMGYHTIVAADAKEALAFVKRFRPDIVLTDALMPGIDGRQLCRLVKAVDRSIKVVVMTALYTANRYRMEALGTFYADDYLAKPIDFGRLQQVLEHLSVAA
jgi:CheY-like chemotaxis protein